MTVSTTPRRAGPFTGNGATTTFPFEFKVFKTSHVAVFVSSGDEVGDRRLSLDADYSVTLDKDAGGVVTLTAPLPVGDKLAIVSDVPYDQQMVLTNRGGFYPTVINDNADYQCAQIQQLREKLDRVLVVPVTSTETPEKVLSDILDTAAHAQEFADQAAVTLAETKELKVQVDGLLEEAQDAKDTAVEARDSVLDIAAPVLENIDTLKPIADNIDAVAATGNAIDAVQTVSDALTTGSEVAWTHDFGRWGVDDTPNQTVGGTIYDVADNIQAIKDVADNLANLIARLDHIDEQTAEALQAASSALAAEARIQGLEDEIREIAATNYEAVAEGK